MGGARGIRSPPSARSPPLGRLPALRLLNLPAATALALLHGSPARLARLLAPWRSSGGYCPSPWHWPWAPPPRRRAPPSLPTSWCCSTAASGVGSTGKRAPPWGAEGLGVGAVGAGWGRRRQSPSLKQAVRDARRDQPCRRWREGGGDDGGKSAGGTV